MVTGNTFVSTATRNRHGTFLAMTFERSISILRKSEPIPQTHQTLPGSGVISDLRKADQEIHSAKSVDNRCGVNQQFANSTLPVKAGDTLGWYVNYKAYPTTGNQDGIYHPGPLTIWMGKVPEGKTAMNWEGD